MDTEIFLDLQQPEVVNLGQENCSQGEGYWWDGTWGLLGLHAAWQSLLC